MTNISNLVTKTSLFTLAAFSILFTTISVSAVLPNDWGNYFKQSFQLLNRSLPKTHCQIASIFDNTYKTSDEIIVNQMRRLDNKISSYSSIVNNVYRSGDMDLYNSQAEKFEELSKDYDSFKASTLEYIDILFQAKTEAESKDCTYSKVYELNTKANELLNKNTIEHERILNKEY
ncbi:MAG: hypothetical protein HC815_17090 [Richelia sp. RM1_1_1]|nr:hypothetical protein [Richelia sp. RM1_1_1]